ncbi:MAG TPA: hypothetical protein VFY04_11385 [Solirubrobacterales bacterium]|nr:hypothetical protein [Solirubrobacterales bacterium]
MSIKKMLLLASMALAAIAAAAPAAQAQGEWTHEGEPITESKEVTFAGTVQFTVVGSSTGVHCKNSHAVAHFLPGGKGEVTTFEGKECRGTGFLVGCTTVHPKSEGLPWPITANTNQTGTISEVNIVNTMTGSFCPVSSTTLTGNVIVTPDNPEETSSVTLSGTVMTSQGEAEVAGTLSVSPAGTYGIE